MDKKKIKRIIAREGIILLFFILIIISHYFLFQPYMAVSIGASPTPINRIFGFTFILSLVGYPLYLLIRFILWVIKILKQKHKKLEN